jgi:branched-chain amino acid transport system permease protein
MTLLELEGVTASYGPVQVLDGVSLSVPEEGAVGILGANGAGKTTTLRAISGTVRAGGRITFDGKDIRGLRPDQVAALGIAHVPEGRGTLGDLTVRDNLRVGAYLRKDRKGVDEDIDYCLDLFPNLQERITSNASALSGGEQQMLAVGRAIMSKPRLMLLDEASLGLAPRSGACGSSPASPWSWSSRTPTSPSPSSTAPRSWRPGGTPSRARPPSSRAWTRSVALTWEVEMGKFVQLVVDGLSTGSVYGALALAIVLVNQATGLINFAQGGMAVLSAYVVWVLTNQGLPLIVAILIAIVFSVVFGALVERWLMRRFERGDPDTAVVVTIGLLTLITGFAGWLWTYNNQQFPSLFSLDTVSFLGVSVSIRSLGTTAVIVVAMLLLQGLFVGTKLGLALRAVAINPQSAAFSGLNVGRLLMVGWGLAAALGAVAAVLVAPQLTLTPGMLDNALVYALAAVILGGLTSPIGVVIAAWIIGILENLAAVYVPFIGFDLKVAVPFILIFVVLLVRPQGLFGRKNVVRV